MRLHTAQFQTPGSRSSSPSLFGPASPPWDGVKSNALSSLPSPPSSTTPTNRHAHNEPNDLHEPHSQPTQSIHRHQQRQQHFTRQDPQDVPRPSSSSGSVPHTLRRTPRLEEQHRGYRRAASTGAPEQRRPTVTFQEAPREVFEGPVQDQDSSTPRASLSQQHQSETPPSSYRPHPATRISRRTASAILYALEEAIRTPYPFTRDLVEENASMADLLGGGPSASSGGPGRGTSNGSNRAAGPVPVQQNPGFRRPREVWRDRQAREAKKKAESEASEREEERRRNTERGPPSASGLDPGAAGVAVGSISAGGGPSGQHRASGNTPTSPPQGDRRYAEHAASGSATRANPTAGVQPAGQSPKMSRMKEPATPSQGTHHSGRGGTQPRRRSIDPGQPVPVQQPQYPGVPSSSQQQPPPQPQTRPIPGAPPTSAQAQADRSGPVSGSQPTQAGPSTDGISGRNPTVTSSFPHAFERWETLSSHWEGLTSYWIRRLEANREEVRREPLAQQMSRQITDLSAAGANLFHAVVELQRLRASSERKFQRWFFETRAEQERAQEVQGEMENTLRRERQQRAEVVANAARLEKENANAEKLVAEMRRELQISKEEARRAWEELGRREQVERERTNSLRDGIPTLVGGVQVVPMTHGALSRHSSVNRQATLDDQYQGVPAQPTSRDQARGEGAGEMPIAGAEGGEYEYGEGDRSPAADERAYADPGPPSSQPLPTGTYPSTTNSITAPSPAAGGGSSFTPHQRTSASPGSSVPAPAPASYQQPDRSQSAETPSSARVQLYQHPGQSVGGQGIQAEDTRSESQGFSEEEEYEMDEQGNILRDEHGNKVVYRRGQHSDDSDDYDEEAEAHERAYMGRYGHPVSGVDYRTSTAAARSGGSGWATYADQDPAYSGAGYGWEYDRHHNPRPLSDVQEEDEKSRTSASRASVASRR